MSFFNKNIRLGLTLLTIMIVTAGCQWEKPDQEIKAEREIALALIHEVQVNIAESFPQQIFIYIKGKLVDSCTTFHDLEIERFDLPTDIHYGGDTIKITVTTERPKDAICDQAYSFFEKNVALGSDFIRGEIYLLDVNGFLTTFEYP